MSNQVLPTKIIILAFLMVLAVFLGIKIADPDAISWGVVGLIVLILSIPVVLKWHHPLLIFSWNLPMIVFFLPGSPSLWMLLGIVSLMLSFLGTIMDKERKLMHEPMMTCAMLSMAVVVLFTMRMTGAGLGLKSLGSVAQGGSKYYYIFLGIIAYFAVSCQRFPAAKCNRYLAYFLLPGSISSISNLIYTLGPSLWFLYYFFPASLAMSQAVEDFGGDALAMRIGRLGGLGVAGNSLFAFFLARYGVKGILDFRKPWRAAMLAVVGVLGLFGGFRSILILYLLLFTTLFFLEGLHRTRLMPFIAVGMLVGGLALLPFTDRLPFSIQRCISVLPVQVNPAVRADAASSTEWRLRMWEAITPEMPKYFWIGKGYTSTAADQYLTAQAIRLGLVRDYESSMIAGDYHNGPLSVIIPFGIWGVLSFLFLLVACFRVLIRNYRFSDPAIQHANTFLLAYFITRVLMFFLVFGTVHGDLLTFGGIVAFSLSLNGGLCQPKLEAPPEPAPAPAPRTRAQPWRWMPARQ